MVLSLVKQLSFFDYVKGKKLIANWDDSNDYTVILNEVSNIIRYAGYDETEPFIMVYGVNSTGGSTYVNVKEGWDEWALVEK